MIHSSLGAMVIPRTTNPSHLQENLKIFEWDLTADEMTALGWVMPVDPEGTEPDEDL